jgi:ABC-type transport system involved in multi-copper enzyme maturation permease subunit
MDDAVNLPKIVIHRAIAMILSVRGVLALLVAFYMAMASAFFLDAFIAEGSVIGELMELFNDNPEFKFLWMFESALTKLVTLFVAPLFVFDAVSGDRSGERLGLILSRPITRTQYMVVNLASSTLAFGIVFLGIMTPAFLFISPKVPELTFTAYMATVFLMYLLGFFTIAFVLMLSTFSKSNLISFIASFGIMSFLMVPNASKYSSDAFMAISKLTPHYYATYFTTHAVEPGLYLLFAAIIVLFAIPFIALAIFKFRREDL